MTGGALEFDWPRDDKCPTCHATDQSQVHRITRACEIEQCGAQREVG